MRAIRVMWRHFRNGFLNLFRNGWMTIASLLAMTLTLAMVGGLVFLFINVDNISTDIEEGVKIRVHIDLIAQPEDEATLQENIESLDQVTRVEYSSKEDEYEMLVDQFGEDFKLFDEENNPFYNVLIVSVSDPDYLDQVQSQINEMNYVVDANYGEEMATDLVSTLKLIRIIVTAISAIFVVIAVLLVSNTIRLTIAARSTEIEIMRLVGAKNSFIKAPLIFEGAFIGIIGAIMGTLLIYAIYQGIRQASIQLVGVTIIRFAPIYPMILYVGVGLLILGMLLGIIGANRSAKRYLTI